MKWTEDQQKAIESRGGTVLVSAAAGSGKTAVLVERVTQRISDPDDPCPADALLVVTFTNAAAAGMRDKIAASIAKKLAEEPDNRHLARQQLLLPLAKICTIDSFCNSLVRENFFALGLSPDFKILEGGEGQILRREIASQTVEKFYALGDADFLGLASLIPGDGVEDVVLKLYDMSQAYPFPETMLDAILDCFRSPEPLGEGVYGGIIREYIADAASYCVAASEKILEIIQGDDALCMAYSPAITDDKQGFSLLAQTAREGDWDAVGTAADKAGKFPRLGASKKITDTSARDTAQNIRNKVIKKIHGDIASFFDINAAEHEQDMRTLAPYAMKLAELTRDFTERFDAAKREKNVIDFSDSEHFALRLLVEKLPDGTTRRTQLAGEISARYREILIDEYQDVNELQDMLFSSLSRDGENLFFVGDVKQSIYGFRQAMPEIFLGRRRSMLPYEPGRYPASVTLDRNFRSRSGVTDAVNFVFDRLMTERAGGVDYKNGEELVAAAEYPDSSDTHTEFHIIDDTCGLDPVTSQAQYIAGLIRKNIDDGLTVTVGGVTRPASFGDFTVLLRSAKNVSARYTEVFAQNGVPAYASLDNGFTDAAEIRFMLSLLRAVDNPCRDIPLLTVLMSPVFGFSPDDMAKLRLPDRKASVYRCVKAGEQRGDARCDGFIKALDRMRRLASTVGTGELIRRLYDETGYLDIVGAMTDAGRRRANLHLLEDYANRYEAHGHIGISGFIRFIDKLERTDSDLAPASALSEAADVVRIMSIHKSKGLEFPVCIIAACEKQFNAADVKSNIVFSRRTGVGMRIADRDKNVLFDTVSRHASVIAARQSIVDEELRVLYVAMTRAKERLILVACDEKPGVTLSLMLPGVSAEGVAPFAVKEADSYEKWLLAALACHPDAYALREAAGTDVETVTAGFPITVKICGLDKRDEPEEADAEQADDGHGYRELIEERLSYVYPYAALSGVAAKRSASELGGDKRADFVLNAPSFTSGSGLSPAERGTAMHKFMQFCDYSAARDDIATQRDLLRDKGFLTSQEADSLDLDRLSAFFRSDVAARIFASNDVFRERRIAVMLPAGEFCMGLAGDIAGEGVLVQGIADCVFIEDGKIVVIDYKTDRADAAELTERYRAQLEFYGRAFAETLGLPVKELLLYSFYLGGCVRIE